MKTHINALALGLLAGVSAHAAEMPGHATSGIASSAPAASAGTHQANAVVNAIDPAKGTITLAHEPVPSLKWPAMTMPFQISPELAKGLKVGQRVRIEFMAKGMAATITAVTAVP